MNTTASCVRVFVAVIAVAGVAAAATRDADPDIRVTPIARDGQVVVSFDLSDGFTPEVRDAIQSGLSTTFSYDVYLRRGATLFDLSDLPMVEVAGRFDMMRVYLPVGVAHRREDDHGEVIDTRIVQGRDFVRVKLDSDGGKHWFLKADVEERP